MQTPNQSHLQAFYEVFLKFSLNKNPKYPKPLPRISRIHHRFSKLSQDSRFPSQGLQEPSFKSTNRVPKVRVHPKLLIQGMWGLNKNTSFVLVPKDLISIEFHEFCKVGLHPNYFIKDLWDLSYTRLTHMTTSLSYFLN